MIGAARRDASYCWAKSQNCPIDPAVVDHRAPCLEPCCGRGRALIEAARIVQTEGLACSIEIVGVDLVGMFGRPGSGLTCLRLVEALPSS